MIAAIFILVIVILALYFYSMNKAKKQEIDPVIPQKKEPELEQVPVP